MASVLGVAAGNLGSAVIASAGLAALFESFGTTGWYPYGPGGAIGQAYYRHILKPVVGDVASTFSDIARKERVELYLKIAAVGVAGVGALGLLVYALRS